MNLRRRDLLAGLGVMTAIPVRAEATVKASHPPYTIWAAANDRLDIPVADCTVRMAVRVTAGARTVRFRLSNAFGTAPLAVVSLHVGQRAEGAAIRAGTNRPVAFTGERGIVIPPGGSAISDAVHCSVAANADLLVSISIQGSPGATTGHLRPKDNSYLAPLDRGADEEASAFAQTVPHWLFAEAVIAEGMPNAGSVAIIGDSITDSGGSPRGSYRGWVDELARRLAHERAGQPLGLVNLGISGNRIAAERPGSGVSALARLDRDGLSHAGVHSLIVFEGINDIYGTPVAAGSLIQAHAQVALRARMAGLRVIGATLLPTRRQGFTSEREGVRAALNRFIRTSELYDHVIDFDAATRDSADPMALALPFDSGDCLHPSAAGYRAMAAAVPLSILFP